jgi:hypothetical protein
MARRLAFLLLLATVLAFAIEAPAWAAPSAEVLGARGGFPTTGFQLAMAGVVAVALVIGGILLRRWSRSHKD